MGPDSHLGSASTQFDTFRRAAEACHPNEAIECLVGGLDRGTGPDSGSVSAIAAIALSPLSSTGGVAITRITGTLAAHSLVALAMSPANSPRYRALTPDSVAP